APERQHGRAEAWRHEVESDPAGNEERDEAKLGEDHRCASCRASASAICAAAAGTGCCPSNVTSGGTVMITVSANGAYAALNAPASASSPLPPCHSNSRE